MRHMFPVLPLLLLLSLAGCGTVERPSRTVSTTLASADTDLRLARSALEGGDAAMAASLFGRVLNNDPESVPARLGLADSLYLSNELEQARQAYQRLLASRQELRAATLGLARIDIRQRKPESAIVHYEALLAKEPGDTLAMAGLGVAYDLLGQHARAQAVYRKGLEIINNETARLYNMVEELLEFSKMEDGRFTLQLEEMDLQAEFEDAIFTYRELFRQEGIELRYEPGEEILPPISGDPERLKQVFCNVLDNAAKHGGSGKRIIASLRRDADNYVIRIRDFGPGIPPAELPYVKQKFYKGSSKARGSGIGLALVDSIMTALDGTMDIQSTLGRGTVVTLGLPLYHKA